MTRFMARDPGSLAVFAPSLMLTVAIEQTSPGRPELHIHAGGQGLWVGRMAESLGAKVALCSALGGESGAVLAGLLGRSGIQLISSTCAAANGAYVHDRRGGERRLVVDIPSRPLTRHELDDLYGKSLMAALDCGTLVLTGSPDRVISPDIYCRLATDARENGVSVVADLSGDELEGALAGGVTLLKISEAELGLEDDASTEAQIDAIASLHGRGAQNVILSRGRAGALALADQALVEVLGPRLTAADHHGTGDSMTAAAAVGISRGLSAPEWLRLSAAAGAVNATRHGLGTGARTEIEHLAEHVELRPLGAKLSGQSAGANGLL
jgi:1-phosphofructokinase